MDSCPPVWLTWTFTPLSAMNGSARLDHLRNLRIGDLRRLWKDFGGKPKLPNMKRLAVRQLAWRIQSQQFGDLDAETRRLLRSAVRESRVETVPASRTRRSSRKKPTRARDLPTGTKLVRKYRGRLHEVTVLESGRRFEYRGGEY